MYDADTLPVNSMAGTLCGLGTAGHKVVLLESLEISTDCFAFRFLLVPKRYIFMPLY